MKSTKLEMWKKVKYRKIYIENERKEKLYQHTLTKFKNQWWELRKIWINLMDSEFNISRERMKTKS